MHAASLHAVVPATGLPSLLSRVVDIVSINGRSLLPVIHIYTDSQGKLRWSLLGCPCLEYTGKPLAPEDHARSASASGSQHFGFHKAPQLVKAVHAVGQSLGIARSDRAWRIACTVADQAIQGPGSTQFSAHECQVDGLPEDSLAVCVCASSTLLTALDAGSTSDSRRHTSTTACCGW